MTLRLRNMGELWLPFYIDPSEAGFVFPFTITTAADIPVRWIAPWLGTIVKLVGIVTAAGTAGAGHTQTIGVERGTTELVDPANIKNAAAIPVGTIVEAFGNGVTFEPGDLMKLRGEEAGTPGGTDAAFTCLGLLVRRHGAVLNQQGF